MKPALWTAVAVLLATALFITLGTILWATPPT